MATDLRPSGETDARSNGLRTRQFLFLAAVVGITIVLETARQLGKTPPLPYMLIFSTAALTAALTGLRSGLLAVSVGSSYIVWGYLQDFGPATLTGSVANVVLSIATVSLACAVLGYQYDRRSRLLALLQTRERELVAARERLAGSVAQTTQHLQRTRSELSDTRYQMEQAIRFAPIGVITIDAERRLQFVNDAATSQFGSESLPDDVDSWDDLLNLVAIFDPDGVRLETRNGPVTMALEQGMGKVDYECRVEGMDSTSRWLSGYVGPVRNTRNDIIGAVIMLVDTTIQKESARALQQLTRMLFTAQEKERSRLARELHEHVGQSLTAIKFSLHSSGERSPQLDASMAQLDTLTNTVRQMSLDLRPTALDDFGLQTALSAYLERQRKGAGVRIVFEIADDLPPVPADLATVAYRLAQEATENAIRHAQANVIAVRLAARDDKLLLEVGDDGNGFDVDATRIKAAGSGKLGLLFMQERARQSGGQLTISSDPQHGTRIEAKLPLNNGASNAENPAGIDR